MKILGPSLDGKYLFTSKGFYVCEQKKFVKYSVNMIPEILKVAKDNAKYQYRNGLISLTEYKLKPKKVLYEFFKVTSPNNYKLVLREWDKEFRPKLGLINESSNKLILEREITKSWDGVEILMEGFWDWLKKKTGKVWSGVKNIASSAISAIGQGLKNVAQKIIVPILKKGVLPLLRWIRRNLNSYAGIIVDLIISVTPGVVVMKVVHTLIVLLDVYEIGTNDYDPAEPERSKMPFVHLVGDIIALLFTSAVAAGPRLALKMAVKSGTKQLGKGAARSLLEKLLTAFPKLKGFVGQAKNFLTKLFGKGVMSFFNKIFSFFDKIITKAMVWIKSLVGQTAKVSVGKLLQGTIGGVAVAEFMKDSELKLGDRGEKVKAAQEGLLSTKEIPELYGGFSQLNYSGPANGVFDKNTENAVKQLQQYYNKKDKSISVTGKIDPKLAFALGIELEPTKFEKIVGSENMRKFGEKMFHFEKWIESLKDKK
jgi:hypothetical protein